MAHRLRLVAWAVLALLIGMGEAAAQHCTISQSPATTLFSPTAWPSSTPATQSFTITINCSTATPVTLAFNKNTSTLAYSGTSIPYSLCQSVVSNVCIAEPLSVPGIVADPAATITLYGFLAAMSAPYATAGVYSDSTIMATTTTGGGVKALAFDLDISKSCSLSTSPLNFGTLALNTTTVKTNLNSASTTMTVQCTNGTTYTVGLNQGTGSGATTTTRVMTGGTGLLNYQLWQNSAHTLNWGDTVGTNTVAGTGTGVTQTLTVYGTVPAGQIVTPGTYSDTVNVIVTY